MGLGTRGCQPISTVQFSSRNTARVLEWKYHKAHIYSTVSIARNYKPEPNNSNSFTGQSIIRGPKLQPDEKAQPRQLSRRAPTCRYAVTVDGQTKRSYADVKHADAEANRILHAFPLLRVKVTDTENLAIDQLTNQMSVGGAVGDESILNGD